ncbi:MBL fold metallo-hydrolase, partial [Streptomyces sp. NPDC005568]|uniref:MBL fold metallo-hydrolase n=1 Tax=Streptomyces sp. NPDC005568 TaxID=3156887 RepID=UPI0033B0914D
ETVGRDQDLAAVVVHEAQQRRLAGQRLGHRVLPLFRAGPLGLLVRVDRAPALGYVVEGEARTYFAGDTGLFDSMAEEVGEVDVALLPVGGWGPHLGEGHLDPERAARALAGLAPRTAVPVHYGTYWPIGMDAVRPHEFHTPGDEFVRRAARWAPGVAVHRLGQGESIRPEVAR